MTLARQLDGLDLIRLGALPQRPNDPRFLVASIDRLRKEVGWRPAFSLDQALSLSIAWWRGMRESGNGAFLCELLK
jgi:nucleoside-diphosphate-sugar epimerase